MFSHGNKVATLNKVHATLSKTLDKVHAKLSKVHMKLKCDIYMCNIGHGEKYGVPQEKLAKGLPLPWGGCCLPNLVQV
jgi:hypothetical protein